MAKIDITTQTDNEIHDIFYYKSRAFKAEEQYLTLKKTQYIEKLKSDLNELEKETASKLQLYSYDTDKTRQLQLDFQLATKKANQRQQKAQDIFLFCLRALRDGHELNELPMVDDTDVDLDHFILGPVTPTIPNPHHFRSSLQSTDSIGFPSSYGLNSFSTNSGPFSSRFSQFMNLPLNLTPTFSNSTANNFQFSQSKSSTNSQHFSPGSDFDLNNHCQGDEFLRMMNLDGSRPVDLINSDSLFLPSFSSGNHLSASSIDSLLFTSNTSNKPPDVIPKAVMSRSADQSPPSQTVFPSQSDGSAVRALDLDGLTLDYPVPGSSANESNRSGQPIKYSQVAASGLEQSNDGSWQAVGSKRAKPGCSKVPSSLITKHANLVFPGTLKSDTDGANFESMVEGIMLRHQLTRPEVIAVLQRVRNDRNGDMNISLNDLMKDAEKLFAHNKNVLKASSLTARAKAAADHPEPCENQLCPARLKQLKFRTELCLSYQTTGTCHMKPGSCVYAHGEAELRPLPKEELCERYLEGKCSNRKCVYAHGSSELKNRPIINAAEILKAKAKKAINGSTGNNVEDVSLVAADHDPQGEECSICFETMSRKSRKKLDCGHDAFHYKCLKKWINSEGDRVCPLCRSNSLIEDEYPVLGSR